VNGDRATLGLVERRITGKQRRGVAVRTESEEGEVEANSFEFLVVQGGRLLAPELGAEAVDDARRARKPVEERLAHEAVIRAGVRWLHAAIVAPPELGRAPVRMHHRRELVRPPRRAAAGEREIPAGAGGLGQLPGSRPSRGVRVLDYDQLDLASLATLPACGYHRRLPPPSVAPAGRSPAPPPPGDTEAAPAAVDSTRRQRGTVLSGPVLLIL
jgi:hypothetical protein